MIIEGIPLKIKRNNNKRYRFNLQSYRNMRNISNSIAKKTIHKIIIEKCRDKPALDLPLELIYTIYRPNKQKINISNIICIIDNFVSSGLVKAGLIPNNSETTIKKVTYIYGGIDRENPRCDLEIIKYKFNTEDIKADQEIKFCEYCGQPILNNYRENK